jgi:hypothetical protein
MVPPTVTDDTPELRVVPTSIVMVSPGVTAMLFR